MSASSFPGLAFPKGETGTESRRARKRRQHSLDERHSATVRQRSGGRCELPHCERAATEVHHFLGGRGRRGIGESALVRNKVHLCLMCHRAVTEHHIRIWWHSIFDRFGTMEDEN